MLELIDETFKIWDAGSGNRGKVDVKFETKEEGQIAKALIKTFSLNTLKDYKDVSSLTDARWALRNGYCQEVGYPLWAIKYCPEMDGQSSKDKICKLIDNIVTICTEVGVKNPAMMVETDSLLTEVKFELMSLIDRAKNNFEAGFMAYLMMEQNVKLIPANYDSAIAYIRQHMESGVGLCEEEEGRKKEEEERIRREEEERKRQEEEEKKRQMATVEKRQKAVAKVKSLSNVDEAKAILNKLCENGYEYVLDIILG